MVKNNKCYRVSILQINVSELKFFIIQDEWKIVIEFDASY